MLIGSNLRRIEHWVGNISITRTHTTLHHDDLLALVCINDGHASDRTVQRQYILVTRCEDSLPVFLQSDRVNSIVGANYEG